MGRTEGRLNSKRAAFLDCLGGAVGLNLAHGQEHDEVRAWEPLETMLYGRWAAPTRHSIRMA
jgi:hypothetical protein